MGEACDGAEGEGHADTAGMWAAAEVAVVVALATAEAVARLVIRQSGDDEEVQCRWVYGSISLKAGLVDAEAPRLLKLLPATEGEELHRLTVEDAGEVDLLRRGDLVDEGAEVRLVG